MKFSKWFGGYLSLENIFPLGRDGHFLKLHDTKLFETFLETLRKQESIFAAAHTVRATI